MDNQPPEEPTEEKSPTEKLAILANLLMEAEALPTPMQEDGCTIDETKLSFYRAFTRSRVLTLYERLTPDFAQHDGGTPSADYHTALNNFALKAKEKGWQHVGTEEGRNLYLHICGHNEVTKKRQEGEWPPPRTQDELKTFVADYVDRKIFSDNLLDRTADLELVFMAIGMGVLSGCSEGELQNIGLIYEYFDKAAPRSVNGFPMFLSVQFMNKADTKRCWAAIKKRFEQLAQLGEIEV